MEVIRYLIGPEWTRLAETMEMTRFRESVADVYQWAVSRFGRKALRYAEEAEVNTGRLPAVGLIVVDLPPPGSLGWPSMSLGGAGGLAGGGPGGGFEGGEPGSVRGPGFPPSGQRQLAFYCHRDAGVLDLLEETLRRLGARDGGGALGGGGGADGGSLEYIFKIPGLAEYLEESAPLCAYTYVQSQWATRQTVRLMLTRRPPWSRLRRRHLAERPITSTTSLVEDPQFWSLLMQEAAPPWAIPRPEGEDTFYPEADPPCIRSLGVVKMIQMGAPATIDNPHPHGQPPIVHHHHSHLYHHPHRSTLLTGTGGLAGSVLAGSQHSGGADASYGMPHWDPKRPWEVVTSPRGGPAPAPGEHGNGSSGADAGGMPAVTSPPALLQRRKEQFLAKHELSLDTSSSNKSVDTGGGAVAGGGGRATPGGGATTTPGGPSTGPAGTEGASTKAGVTTSGGLSAPPPLLAVSASREASLCAAHTLPSSPPHSAVMVCLRDILWRGARAAMTPEEKTLLWSHRHHVWSLSHSLPRVLAALPPPTLTVLTPRSSRDRRGQAAAAGGGGGLSKPGDLDSPGRLARMNGDCHLWISHQLLRAWPALDPVDALELLSISNALNDPVVVGYAISCVASMPDRELADILPQLTQTLMTRGKCSLALARFLVARMVGSPYELGHVMFWHLKAEMSIHSNATEAVRWFGLVLEEYLCVCAFHRRQLLIQSDMMSQLVAIAREVKSLPHAERDKGLPEPIIRGLQAVDDAMQRGLVSSQRVHEASSFLRNDVAPASSAATPSAATGAGPDKPWLSGSSQGAGGGGLPPSNGGVPGDTRLSHSAGAGTLSSLSEPSLGSSSFHSSGGQQPTGRRPRPGSAPGYILPYTNGHPPPLQLASGGADEPEFDKLPCGVKKSDAGGGLSVRPERRRVSEGVPWEREEDRSRGVVGPETKGAGGVDSKGGLMGGKRLPEGDREATGLSSVSSSASSAAATSRAAQSGEVPCETAGVSTVRTYQLPLDPSLAVRGLDVSRCRCLKSKKAPLLLVFDNADDAGDQIHAILKVGDDLRQDMLSLRMLKIMANLWRREGLDMRINAYGCVALSAEVGLIQVVRPAETIANITKSAGGVAGAFGKNHISNWLHAHNPGRAEYAACVENFLYSCAGYCVATYVLGVGDRHNDNIMLTHSGCLFHVDFGHFLGHFKSKFGFKREKAPFVLTPDFAHVMGGPKGAAFARFKSVCCQAYNVLRAHAHLFINLLSLMTNHGIPELRGEGDVQFLRDSLCLHLTEEQAAAHFQELIQLSLNDTRTRVNNAIHIFVNS
eukprot:jgi/Mesvir1/6163/Mv00858-RA.1